MAGQKTYDAVVVGAGIIGSSCAWQLAKQGLDTLLIDKQPTPHEQGSSHGQTRLIRKAYFEHPDYVPLLQRSYELWHELSQRSSQKLIYLNGVMIAGPKEHEVIQGVRLSARTHQIEIQELTSEEVFSIAPSLRLPSNFKVLLEKDAGYTLVEESIKVLHQEFLKHGGTWQLHSRALSWKKISSDDTVELATETGVIKTRKLVLAAGSWMPLLLKTQHLNLVARRVAIFWLDPPEGFKQGQGGVAFGVAMPQGFFYGVPDIDGYGMKVGLHLGLDRIDEPDAAQQLRESDWQTIETFMKEIFGVKQPDMKAHSLCRYTMSNDQHFVLGFLPGSEQVIIASACSGHGFKFGPVVGEIVAEIITQGQTSKSIDFLSPQRAALRLAST